MYLNVGESVERVWRPSPYTDSEIIQALNVTKIERRMTEQALRLLIDRFDEIFLFIEPSAASLHTFGHKIRELLILACTEVEYLWKSYMTVAGAIPAGRNFSTNDYVKLVDKLHLREYEFSLKPYSAMPAIRPFETWNPASPTASLPWYDTYNKTKHGRDAHFDKATLLNCINAVIAALVLYCVKFSPMPMFNQDNAFSTLINQHFELNLINCDVRSFYLPVVDLPSSTRKDLFIFDPSREGLSQPFTVKPLVL